MLTILNIIQASSKAMTENAHPEDKYSHCISDDCPFGKTNMDSAIQQDTMLNKKVTYILIISVVP